MSDQTIPRTWLAGDGAGVILACNGNCPDTPAGDLVVAEYGETATSRPEIRKFPLGDLAEFLAFADTHAYNCTPPEELDADAPHWGPLRACLPADQLDGWMWMARSTYNGVIVEHSTRARLTEAGKAAVLSGDYQPPNGGIDRLRAALTDIAEHAEARAHYLGMEPIAVIARQALESGPA
ncbi:hypothetical protein [Actinoplanes campanulatus]|uniref:hypothetical protein n=1 Tax=Actinoplanes campanulatus TaxID=113559 RepID=UPI00194424FD|nr:hypothetical protein [Actinoplanes campanulatus]GID40141.1 hypothetical protein Aca09nite_66470 [Actinoplanes campanulatus]